MPDPVSIPLLKKACPQCCTNSYKEVFVWAEQGEGEGRGGGGQLHNLHDPAAADQGGFFQATLGVAVAIWMVRGVCDPSP